MAKLKYSHKIKTIDVNEIRLNKYNPNVMEPELMTQLNERMKEEGILQPILLRHIEPKGKIKYEVVDGEHRYLAAKNIGYEEIPAIVLDKKLPEAMISSINMNKLRGEFDTLRLAEVIHTLHKTYSIEELERKLGYTSEQVKGLENLLEYDFDSFNDEGVKLEENMPEEYEFKIMLNAKQNRIIEKAIKITKKEDIPDALVTICLEYLTKHDRK